MLIGVLEAQVPGADLVDKAMGGQVEMDRGDRDAVVGDGVNVAARFKVAGGLVAADPVIRTPRRIEALDQLVTVDAAAETGDLDSGDLPLWHIRNVDVEQD